MKLNFGAAKLQIEGDVTLEEINRTGAFDGIRAFPEGNQIGEMEPVWKSRNAWSAGIAGIFLILAWMAEIFQSSHLFVLGLYGLAIAVGGYATAKKGWRGLLRFNFDMNTLMLIAVSGAVLIGEWSEAAVISFLFAVSELLENYSMDKARNAIRSLMKISPKKATVVRDGQEMELAVEEIEVGDMMLVKPGEKIAMDGVVIEGESSVNQAAITGESIPVEKQKNDEVYAGTLNQQGFLKIKVSRAVEDTTLAKIIHLVEEAQSERAPSQAFVDRFAKYYTPSVMVLALLIILIPPLLFGGGWHDWIYRGLALLVVACPCALVVSTPVAIVSAIGSAARQGVLVKGGIYLEELGKAKVIAFDKTGTLTEGQPRVIDILSLEQPDNEQNRKKILALAAALESKSEHPLARAVVGRAKVDGAEVPVAEQFESMTGQGVSGRIDGVRYVVGSPEMIRAKIPIPSEQEQRIHHWQSQGKTVIGLANEREILGWLSIADTVRPQASSVIHNLKSLDVQKVVMLTGDNRLTADAIAKDSGLDEVHSELMPQDKLERIHELKNRHGTTAMVGDGINDAPALAASSVGIAMGGAGTDTAMETADVVIMGDDLTKIPYAVKLSRATLRVIKQNITFSLAVKLLAVLAVFPGWLTLWLAILADMGATILVTINGIRLIGIKSE